MLASPICSDTTPICAKGAGFGPVPKYPSRRIAVECIIQMPCCPERRSFEALSCLRVENRAVYILELLVRRNGSGVGKLSGG